MLVQDHLGYVHEVPEHHMGGVVFDGLGNPVGLFPALAAALPAIGGLFAKAAPAIASAIPGVGKLIGGLFGGGGGAPAPAPAAAPMPMIPRISIAPPAFPQIGPMLRNLFPIRHCAPPIGWTTPAIPYTGLGPRRMYMRCAVWPGPAGLVPVSAAMAPPVSPAAAAAAAAAQAAAAGGGRRRFRRRR
jgi:hypothetical protein